MQTKNTRDGVRKVHGYCTLCRSRCGTINTISNDHLVKVEPDRAHPTGAAICMKGRAAPELIDNPYRILHPLKRTTAKGSGDAGWQRISWSEAINTIAERLIRVRDVYGPESFAFSVTSPSGTPLSDSIDWIERFIRYYGSPNLCYGTELCNWHKDFAHSFTFGCGIQPADYANSDTILLWGNNPTSTWLAQATAIAKGRASGANLIVVDPRPTRSAIQADVWLRVRPGTDAALILGLINIIIKRKLYSNNFVRQWTNAPFLVRQDNGLFLRERDVCLDSKTNYYMIWDLEKKCLFPVDPSSTYIKNSALLDGSIEVAVLGDSRNRANLTKCTPVFDLLSQEVGVWTAERVAATTGVETKELYAAAELLKAPRRLAYHTWAGLSQHSNATQTERALSILYALNGSFDRIGGNRVRRLPIRTVNAMEHIQPIAKRMALGIKERPIGPAASGWITGSDLYRAILDHDPYEIHGLMSFGTNLLLSQADTQRAKAALIALPFHVHCDLFMTPSAQYADIFLPVNTPWEHEGLRPGFEISDEAAALIQLRQRMIQPRGESRSDNEIVFELATRIGLGDKFFNGDLEAGWNYILEPSGLTVDELRRHESGVTIPLDLRECKYATANEAEKRDAGFATETGRVELYSEFLLRSGENPLPTGELVQQLPGFPYILTSAKNGYYCHSQHRSLPSLRRRSPFPSAMISVALSRQQHIADGDWIRISTASGSARFVAQIAELLADDVVVAEHGWWQASPELGLNSIPIDGAESSNFNGLVSSRVHDRISGAVDHKSTVCNVVLDDASADAGKRWNGYRQLEVVGKTKIIDDVCLLTLAAAGDSMLAPYRNGQYIGVRAMLNGTSVTRTYSLLDGTIGASPRRYRIAVRKVRGDDGVTANGASMSRHLNDDVEIGDVIDVAAPEGAFLLPSALGCKIILVAGGIGITPFLSYIDGLKDNNETRITLFYGNKNKQSHAFRLKLAERAERVKSFKVINCYSDPASDDLKGVDYQKAGRLDSEDVWREIDGEEARIYMCGPKGMMEEVKRGAADKGFATYKVFEERFRTAFDDTRLPTREYKMVFARSGKRVSWVPNAGTILEQAERAGVALPSGCRVGQCETCAVRVITGDVQYVGESEQKGVDMCLTCIAVPRSDLVLDA